MTKNLTEKLPNQSFAKKLLIVSIGLLGLSMVFIFVLLIKIYSMVGENLDTNVKTITLDRYQEYITIATITVRVCIVVIIIAGAIVAYQHEKK